MPTVPHLAPLAIDTPWVHELTGIVLNDASALGAQRTTVDILGREKTTHNLEGTVGVAVFF